MLLSIEADAKTRKGSAKGWLTGILYLAPHDTAIPGKSICPDSTPGCRASCLYTAGRGSFGNVQQARIAKTQRFFADRAGFIAELDHDITRLCHIASKRRMHPVVRLNGTSDLAWERLAPQLFTRHPNVQFYDYTKSPNRMAAFQAGKLPANYMLTLSRSESNEPLCLDVLQGGGTVAAVFDVALPKQWHGFRVINGDKHDLRFKDPRGAVVGLLAKGRAKHDTSGFVVHTQPEGDTL